LQDIPDWEVLVMNSINQGAAGPAAQANMGALGSAANALYQGAGGTTDRQTAKKALEEKRKEGHTLQVTILRKKIRPVEQTPDRKIERVIFCSDLR
jgi:hypothetical protein